MLGHIAIVFQRLLAIGFLVRSGERDVADFQQLGRGEERHVGGIVKEGIDEAALVHQDGRKSGALGFNRGRHSRRPCADHQYVK